MPDDKIKISALPSALSLNNTDVFSVVQGMDGDNKTTRKAALTVLAAHLLEVMQYNDLDTASKTIVDAINSVLNNLADEYDESLTYSVGDCVQHNGLLYQCNTAITTAEQWDPTHWTQIKAVDVGSGGGGGGLPSDVIAPDYDSSQTYEVGDYVMHEDQLYVCSTDISTAEAWDPTHWTLTSVEAEMKKKADTSNTYTKAQTDGKIEELIDDTQALNTKVWSSKKTYDEIVNILPTGNASGSIANFSTSLALPMEIVADVNASGGGGTPSTPIPIVGASSVTVTDADENMQAQETETINLGGTYYGGHFTQDKDGHRQFEATFEKKKFSEISNWYKGSLNTAQTGRQWYADLNSNPTYNSDANTLCDSLTPSDSNWGALALNEYHSLNRYFVMVVDDIYADKTAMLSALGNYEFTLKLKTPVTIPLADGEPINALVGTNNVYTDSGNISVTYKKSIDDAIAELQALILNA